jgi:hypothetical protein
MNKKFHTQSSLFVSLQTSMLTAKKWYLKLQELPCAYPVGVHSMRRKQQS